jgi:mitogen-activated protein kinase kinase kinase 11
MTERSSSVAPNKPVVDAGLLRRTLRLVHCLQKERGASCAYLYGDKFLGDARMDTDHAILDCHDILQGEAPIRVILEKMRGMLDEQDISFHRTLVFFNTLISSVLHEHVLKYTTKTDSNMMQRNVGSKNMVGSKSHHNFKSIMSVDDNIAEVQHRRRKTKSTDFASKLSMFDLTCSSMVLSLQTHNTPAVMESTPGRTSGYSVDFDGGVDILQSTQDHVSSSRLSSLLQLLGIFVSIKESTGVERASLYAMLALGQADSRLLLNDVVLEVENQRRQIEKLQHIQGHPLQNLVQELVVMSEDMQQVQGMLSSGCMMEVIQEHYNAQQLWDVLSVYMDKLHSLELLIIEEMELVLPPSCAPVAIQDQSGLSQVLVDAFGEVAITKLQRVIERASPEDIKRRLLDAICQQTQTVNIAANELQPNISDKGVDELLNDLYGNVPAMKEWEIDVYELKFLKRIGQGAAGTTYLADWAGDNVAVKVASITEIGLDGWRTEVQALQKLHHPNIIRLLGSVYHQQPLTFCLVLEYCDGGDLATAMTKTVPSNFFFHVATSIAKGLVYLHHRGVIHRDIKPLNVLLNGDLASGQYQVKLTDFGVAADLNNLEDRCPETGTYRWMSPEVIRHEAYTQTADVYSYGIILWQLLTREDPFADMGQIEAAAVVAMEMKRPPFPLDTPVTIKALIEQCWAEDPSSRPPFTEIVAALNNLAANLADDEKKWLDAPLGHAVYKKKRKEHSRPPTPSVQLPPEKQGQNNRLDIKKKKKFGLFARKSSHF